jgi:transposase-like protein
MMNPSSYELESLNLSQLADLREWQLERLEKVTGELRRRVQTEYEAGANIKALAKKAGVTRRTIYSWLGQ